LDSLPPEFVDLLIIDPPYNLDKNFHGIKFSKTDDGAYLEYLKSWFPKIMDTLKPNGSVYLCGDWKSTFCLYQVMRDFTIIRNRIIWQREKGRGAKANWKNTTEDIWFGTKSGKYYFNAGAVKLKRKVIAPYRQDGKPKDWEETEGGKFRLTYPGNFWDDISVPYWSMPENTDHPAQKPEKLIAKLILASCPENGIVLDPFLGSGTTSVTAKKLGRQYIGIEINEDYCCWAEKRLLLSDTDKSIQGYSDGIFWERNTLNLQKQKDKRNSQ
jgi:site-specific DNA-methyltransferase (adenine-specific)